MKKKYIILAIILVISIIGIFILTKIIINKDKNDSNEEVSIVNIVDKTSLTEYAILPKDKSEINPLKGFIPYAGDFDFPYSMEWFYIPLSSLQTGFDSFDWTELETQLNNIAERGHQACFRVYLDFPLRRAGIPQFLLEGGLSVYDYKEHGGGTSPDYQDPNLVKALTSFITAFGKYDGDPRIGFITTGLLGFWGEWHTWPYDSDTSDGLPNIEPSIATMNAVLDAYEASFKTTPILVRYPVANAPKLNFGYHDDSFGFETLLREPYHFFAKLKLAEVQLKWKTNPIGGELRPEIQQDIFNEDPWGASYDRWEDCVSTLHPTWLINDAIISYEGNVKKCAIYASKEMGYDFRINNAYYNNIMLKDPMNVAIDIENVGVAPFYYKWEFRIGVKQDGVVIKSWDSGWDITSVESKSEKSFEFGISNHGLEEGIYTYVIKLVNPLENGLNVRFANVNQDENDWLELGTFAIGEESIQKLNNQPTADQDQVYTPETRPSPVVEPTPVPIIIVGGTDYEAEAVGNTRNGEVVVAPSANASGSTKVGYIGNGPENHLIINNINIKKAGEYTVYLSYFVSGKRSFFVSVNNGEEIEVVCKAKSWDNPTVYEMKLTFIEGTNSIKIGNATAYAPDLDKITVMDTE